MKTRMVYLNGEFVPDTEAKISIYDSALMFGDMVFEMTRSFKKRQFRLIEHIERLMTGVKILRIPLNLKTDDILDICYRTIEINDAVFNPTDEHRLVINASRGPLSTYSEVFNGKMEPTFVVADIPLKWTVQKMGILFDTGINAVVPSQRAIPGYLLDPKIKNRSRLHYQMANIEVSGYEGTNNWALLLDPDGFVAEGTGDNFFIVKYRSGQTPIVITPEPRNILRGISRDYVMNTLCPDLGWECIEKNIELYDVYSADEAFMTATPFCMLPVTSLNSTPIGDGKRGVVFDSLLKKWSELVEVDIENQIKKFNVETESWASDGPSPYSFKKK